MDDTEDINRLIRELNDDRPGSGGDADEPPRPSASTAGSRSSSPRAGSDLLLVAGAPPSIRVDGASSPLCRSRRSPARRSRKRSCPALPPHARARTARAESPTRRYRVRGLGRFRINLHRERGRAAAAVRALPAAAAAPRDARACRPAPRR